MALAIDGVDKRGPSNEMHPKLHSKKAKVQV